MTLKAKPEPGYYVKGWYDNNGGLVSIHRTLDVVMDSNQTFTVKFRLPDVIEVSGDGDAIQGAVNAAENGDTLVVAAGTYNGGIDDLQGKEIKLVGVNPDDPDVVEYTVIDCASSGRAFTFDSGEDANTVIDGFKVINGNLTDQPGGAIYIGSGASPTIVNLAISGCSVTNSNGGAIYVGFGSSPTFRNVRINSCSVTNSDGGAIYVSTNSAPEFIDCTVGNCSVTRGSGGAVYCNTSSWPVFVDCAFVNNTADFGFDLTDPNDPNVVLA
ncbi:MAG: right-handed parallel beta-helix repeat-containing protein, partial [Planctomycetota bacterium]